ncbi:hypothetical protein SRIMM317S_00688 [Streptomyces rimosus subsp. rimosus]
MHSGTSETSCRRTVSVSRPRTVAMVVSRSSVCSRAWSVQYRLRATPERPTVTISPGSTSRIPEKTVRPGVLTMSSTSHRPSAVTRRRSEGCASTAFGSEPNSTPVAVGW